MAEASIAVSLKDLYSSGVKSMSEKTKAFSKDADTARSKLEALGIKQEYLVKKQAKLKTSTEEARKEMVRAQKAFRENADEVNRTKLEKATEQFFGLQEAMKAFRDESNRVRKEAGQLQGTLSKMDNQPTAKTTSLAKGLVSAGFLKVLESSLSQAAGYYTESFLGQPDATLASSLVSGALSGAASGAILGPWGALAGAGIGAFSGYLSGKTQIARAKDDAFKSYVQEAYNTVTQEQADSLTRGSSLAAGRETDKISFATLFKDAGIADQYLSDLVEMANNTPFLYDDLTAMSKTLATYGYGAGDILPVLKTVGDAGAALGMSTSDMNMVSTAIGRMKSSNKTTLEYLNILNDRGIGAVGMLSNAYGVDQGTMYDMISKGKVEGTKAAEIILTALTDSFSGAMERQSKTFSGLTSTVEGLSQELDNAMGEGYNEGRMAGLRAQRDWLSGQSGDAVMEANKAIGAWKAKLENQKEAFVRDAVDDMMGSDEYQAAKAAGDAAEMGRLIMEAKVQGMNEYNASDGARLLLESEKSLIEAIRDDTSLDADYWQAGYEKSQEFTKGLAAGIAAYSGFATAYADPSNPTAGTVGYDSMLDGAGGYAAGIDYVPYDNFPALLHQGERVLTAAEARSERGAPTINITGNHFTVREEADIHRVASELLTQMELAGQRG